MKGAISGIITVIMLANIAYGYTVTVTINGIQDKSTSEAGNTVQIIPKEEVEYWEVESGGITITNNQFIMPENDVSIIGITAETTYTITSTAEGNGTISPEGETEVTRGESQTYTITANSGYEINEVTVDGISKGAISIYTFNNVTANHTITATFKAKTTATIVSQAGEGGGITPEGPQEITIGESQTYTITANSGNIIYDVIVDGESQGGITEYTFSNVTSNHTIRAEFTESDYLTRSRTLTINPNGGTWEGKAEEQEILGTYGSTITIGVASRADAYKVEINTNGGESETSSITANGFKTWGKEGGGTLEYNTSKQATFTYGAGNTTLTAIYNESEITLPTATRTGYTLNGWYTEASGGTKIGNPGESYTPTGNITLYAQWTAKTAVEITLHSNTANAITTQVEVAVNGQLPQNTYKNEGYAFTGWNTKADGTGKSYEDMGTYNETTGTTLYAQWEEATGYKLTIREIGAGIEREQKAGEKVIITATQDDTYLTPTWSSEEATLSNTTGKQVSFIMPNQDTTIKLKYNQKHTLKAILDGTVEETYKIAEGEEVKLEARPRVGESIIGWEATGIELGNVVGSEITFTMPGNDVTVRAIPGQYKLTTKVTNEAIGIERNQRAGDTVTITADSIEGQSFIEWELEGIEIQDPTKETITFIMPYNDVTIKGRYEKYTLTKEIGNGTKESSYVTAGRQITITAEPPGGQSFLEWEVSGITLTEEQKRSNPVVITMPQSNVTIKAILSEYKLITKLSNKEMGIERYQKAGDEVTITADEISGKSFIRWEVEGVEVENPTSETITFIMPSRNVKITGKYE